MDTEYKVYQLGVNPPQDWDTYIYTYPMREMSTLSLYFVNPDIPVNLYPDVFYNVPANIDAALQVIVLTCPNHNLAIDDRIFIEGFDCKSAVITKWLNRPEGHLVGTNGLTANTFRLNPEPDTTGLGWALGERINGTGTQILIAKRRLLMVQRYRTKSGTAIIK